MAENTRYVLKFNDESPRGDYVCLDTYSGGYPARTDVLRAHTFDKLKDAKKYKKMFPKLMVVEQTINIVEKIIEV